MSSNYGAYGSAYQGANYASYTAGYPVDIVLCIDATGSMENRNLLDHVKSGAINFYDDLCAVMERKSKHVSQIRVRAIAFRDYLASMDDGLAPMQVTPFYRLPEESAAFSSAIESIEAIGGGDDPEDGLEALGYAMNSPWDMSSGKHRHVIVLWSDEEPHELGFGSSCPSYPKKMAKSFIELGDWWGTKDDPGKMPDQSGKRLVLYAPDRGYWSRISANWDCVVHVPSTAGSGMGDEVYQRLLSLIANSI